jgi:hypothetical protein
MRYVLLAVLIALPALAQAEAAAPAPAYVLRQGNGTATLLDRAGIRRQGQIATITSMLIYAEPVRSGEVDWYWNDATDQFDCQAHAYRSAAAARLTLERDKAQGLNDPDASEDWTPVDPGSLTAKEEALACKGETGGMRPVPDVKAFARAFAGVG